MIRYSTYLSLILTLGAFPLRAETPPSEDSEIPKAAEGLTAADWAGIRTAYEKGRHAIVADVAGGHEARNPNQLWQTKFDGRGFTVVPDGQEWSWGLELKSYGYTGSTGSDLEITGAAPVNSGPERLEYIHDENLTEWFVNDCRGLEQGWTLRKRPEGAAAGARLKLELGVRGGLGAKVENGGSAVVFTDAAGASVIRYAGLKAWDADGKNVPVNFEEDERGEDNRGFRVVADDAGARYPITIDPVAQQAMLKASNARNSDRFGYAVAISGYTVVVGAPLENSKATGVNGNQSLPGGNYTGAAFVFVREGATWTQQAYLKASNTASQQFGLAVAISGDTIVIGGPGDSGNSSGVNGSQVQNGAGGSGAAYVFTRNGSTWTQQAYMKASNPGASDEFGKSVGISGDTIVVGAPGEDSGGTGVNGNQADNMGLDAGAAYVFARSGTVWSQQAYLKASNARRWSTFGQSVAVAGDTVVVGAPDEYTVPSGINGNETEYPDRVSYGAAYIYARSGTAWSQQAFVKLGNSFSYAQLGFSVAAFGDKVLVGAPGEGSSSTGVNSGLNDFGAYNSGAAFLYNRSGTTWTLEAYFKASNTGANDAFGRSVGMSGDTVVVGAYVEGSASTGINGSQTNDVLDAELSGAAYVFVKTGSFWSQQSYLKSSSAGDTEFFGNSVAVSGSTVVVGTPHDVNQYNTLFEYPGESYIFEGFGSWFSLSTIAANGKVTGGGDYKTGSNVTLSATANPGYVFFNWSGAATGATASVQVLVNGNKTATAVFIPDTLDPDNDGLDNYNEIVVQGTNPNVADTDGDGYQDGYEVQNLSNPKNPASVPTFTLSFENSGAFTGGTLAKSGSLAHGTTATVTATPDAGYILGSWTGDGSGSNNPLTLTMDSNKVVGVVFAGDPADPDEDGLDNYTEIVLKKTNPNVADTDGDGYSDGYEATHAADPKDGSSVPTFTLELEGDGVSTGGVFQKSGTLAHGTQATLTATPLPGYLFGEWTEDASGSENPLSLLMDSNKVAGASFVHDGGDSDKDGLSNYQEIIVLKTDPQKADSDGDGVNDGKEVADKTNPLMPDTDGDGLDDGLEKRLATNPLRKDSNGDGTADADEDADRDGISNGREANELGMDPKSTDSDGDGLTDTFEVAFVGKTKPFTPRVGDEIMLDLRKLDFDGTIRIEGDLPPGLRYDPVKKVLKGTLSGKPGQYSLKLQLFNGRSYVGGISLPIRVNAFPTGLAGIYQGLLEDENGNPLGMVEVNVSAPGKGPAASGTWTASLDSAGGDLVRAAAGDISLEPAERAAIVEMNFPAKKGMSATRASLRIEASSSIANGVCSVPAEKLVGGIRGFRLARGMEKGAARQFTMIIDQGELDGFTAPAGLGWAVGSMTGGGVIPMSGQLGDSQRFDARPKLSESGQAILWVKPYGNVDSYLGGIITLPADPVARTAAAEELEPGLRWFRAKDGSEPSYPKGFGPLEARTGFTTYDVPSNAAGLAKALGLKKKTFKHVLIEGAGLPVLAGGAVLPGQFSLESDFGLKALPIAGGKPVPWNGSVEKSDGSFTGVLDLPRSGFGMSGGKAKARGVLIPGAGYEGIVAAGFVKVPVDDKPGAFRTAAMVISK